MVCCHFHFQTRRRHLQQHWEHRSTGNPHSLYVDYHETEVSNPLNTVPTDDERGDIRLLPPEVNYQLFCLGGALKKIVPAPGRQRHHLILVCRPPCPPTL